MWSSIELTAAELIAHPAPRYVGPLRDSFGRRINYLRISLTDACNLRCVGCYADSGPTAEKLDWDTLDRLVTDAKTLWEARYFAISGGEPLAYHSDGKGILDIAEKHPDCFFLMYTNGTLIDDKVAARLAQLGNLSPAISLEGWRERTDARRGAGIFDKVLEAMNRLRAAGVLFGVSLTPTCDNAEEILSDEFVDFCFRQQGALFGWMFQYMPIGRSFTLDLMPTPQQRLWMWRRSWEIIRERQIFLVDFWNHGTLSQGCISAGRSTGGGYLYVDWNGAISPCVFMPYSPVNVRELFARGQTLEDAWELPFFAALRDWQRGYGYREPGQPHAGVRNWLRPCPIRDHHAEFMQIVRRHQPRPNDPDAAAALADPAYHAGLERFDRELAELSDPLWAEHVRGNGRGH